LPPQILERQQKLKPGEAEMLPVTAATAASALTGRDAVDDSALEMGITKRRRAQD
jgi:hypothetical protein